MSRKPYARERYSDSETIYRFGGLTLYVHKADGHEHGKGWSWMLYRGDDELAGCGYDKTWERLRTHREALESGLEIAKRDHGAIISVTG